MYVYLKSINAKSLYIITLLVLDMRDVVQWVKLGMVVEIIQLLLQTLIIDVLLITNIYLLHYWNDHIIFVNKSVYNKINNNFNFFFLIRMDKIIASYF